MGTDVRGNMLGWVPTWVLIAVVVPLLVVIVVLASALKTQFEETDLDDKNAPRQL